MNSSLSNEITALSGAGSTLISAALLVVSYLQYLLARRPSEEPHPPPPRGDPPPETLARVSVGFGGAACLFGLAVVIFYGYMPWNLGQTPPFGLTAGVAVLVLIEAGCGFWTLRKARAYPGNRFALQAGSGQIAALGAAIAMWIIAA